MIACSLQAEVVIGKQGTNAPGTGSNFTFTSPTNRTGMRITFGAQTNTAYSYLFLKKNGVPTETDFDYVSRSDVWTNRICVEQPEFDPAVTNYGLRVFTPPASPTHSFMVAIAASAPDRAVVRPAVKPASFTVSGVLTNSASLPLAQWHVFQMDVPSALASWSIVLQTTNDLVPDLYIRKELPPATNEWLKATLSGNPRELILTNGEIAAGTWFVGVHLPVAGTNTSYTLTAAATLPELSLLFDTTGGSLVVSNGFFLMRAVGPTNATVVLEQSTTLADWRPCATNTMTNGNWQLAAPFGTGPQQFFRLHQP